MVGKILASILGTLVSLILILVICYLTISGFKKWVDDGLGKPQTEETQGTETDGTEEVPNTAAFVSFANNTITIEV